MKPRRAPQQGLTLLELAIAMAVLAVLSALALPSFGGRIERARTQAAAEALAADLTEARFEAARRGLPVYVQATPGSDWCWVVSTLPDCPCGQAQPCQLRSAAARQHRGVELMNGVSLRLDPSGQPSAAQSLELRTRRNDRLRVELSPMGRARLCAVAGNWSRIPGC
jgi:type IV fimbrial biogenesis protein FimT